MWLSRSALWIALICGLGSLTLSPVHGQEKDCTVVNSDTKEFYDLRPLIKKSGEDWTVKSIDDHTYKLNVCHEILDGTTGMREPGGVGSFVRKDVKGISLGKQNSSPLIAENRLRLQYKDGDECPNSLRRRSTLIYLECDKTIQGLGAPEYLDNIDECTYMFLWKTPHACPTAQGGGSKISGGAIFAIILSVLFGVYWIGGILYKRIVMGQRGFNQLPNAEYWRALANFVKNFFGMVFPSCCANRSRQYNYGHVNTDEANVFIDDDDEE